MEKGLTYKEVIEYNKGKPIRCQCGRIIGYKVDNDIFIFCRSCKKQINVSAKSQ